MEPVTHFLTGACLGRAGFNRKAAYATFAMTLGAEMPDVDMLWGIRGPVVSFQHHRGITHTLIGFPVEAAVIVGLAWLIHRWRTAKGQTTVAPVRWGLLYIFSFIALLSHILLDWTNNYGIRPFFPFNPHWYAGGFVFIFEPLIFLALLSAFIAPPLFGLIGSEVGAKKQPFRGRGWAIFALGFVVILWGVRAFDRVLAERVAATQLLTNVDGSTAPVLRSFGNPHPLNPLAWHVIVETPNFYQLMSVDTLLNTASTDPQDDRFYKRADTPAILAAKESPAGRVYLDWAKFPIIDAQTDPKDPSRTVVVFRDLRFMYNTSLYHGRTSTPLSATVYVDRQNHVVRQQMGDEEQR